MAEKLTLSLRWGSHQETVLHSLGNSFGSQDFVDLTLACEGQSVQAHKVVVSACSSFLKKLLQDNPCSHPIIILKDVTMMELKQLLEFMYCGQVTVEQRQLESLLHAAQVLGVYGLTDVNCSDNNQGMANDTDTSEGKTGQSCEARKSKTSQLLKKNSILASYLLHSPPQQNKSLSLVELLSQPTASNASDSVIAELLSQSTSDDNVEGSLENQEHFKSPTDSVSELDLEVKQEEIDLDLDAEFRNNQEDTDPLATGLDDNLSTKTMGKATAFMLSLAKRANRAASLPYTSHGERSLPFADSKTCTICGQVLRDDNALRFHMSNVHTHCQSNINAAAALSGGSSDGSADHRLAFYEARPCSVCGKMYRDAASLRTHLSIMHQKWRDGFECTCKQVFPTKYEMYQHRKTHGKPGRGWSSPI